MVTPGQAKDVLNALQIKKPDGFSTHDFIEEYCSQNEREYIIWLLRKSGSGRAFQTVHSQIGRYLSKNARDLQILKIGNDESETVHGTKGMPMWFAWGAE